MNFLTKKKKVDFYQFLILENHIIIERNVRIE